MRKILAVAALGLAGLTACSKESVAPADLASMDAFESDLVPDYALSSTAVIDGAGIGAARLPEELQLTAEQKAEIAVLHEAFLADHEDEIAQLRSIERQIRQLRRTGGTREQVMELLSQARPILAALAADFAELQRAIWNVYTDEQRAWIESHKPQVCDRRGPPRLTDQQIAEIRTLKEAFMEAVADELAAIKAAHQQAREARQAGASAAEIRAILESVKDELAAVRQAEVRLMNAIHDVLTPDQRRRWCGRV